MIESDKYYSQEKKNPPRGVVVLDLDGVVTRWTSAHLPNQKDLALFHKMIEKLHKEEILITALTNRPPGQMAPWAYNFGMNEGIWVTESGGSIYYPGEHRNAVAPQWYKYATSHVPHLRNILIETRLVNNVPNVGKYHDAQFEPGMGFVKTNIIPPFGISTKEYVLEVKEIIGRYSMSDLFELKPGKAIDVDPIGLSKKEGMKLLLSSNNINPTNTPTIFIADHIRDIDAAQPLVDLGGVVAAVGNSDFEYKKEVEKHGGIVAPDSTQYHSSVAYILNKWLTTLK